MPIIGGETNEQMCMSQTNTLYNIAQDTFEEAKDSMHADLELF